MILTVNDLYTTIKKIIRSIRSFIINILVLFLRGYQIMISPYLPQSCRFTPTCSTYSIQAIRKYGVFKGLLKSAYRVLRCNPFSRGGYDPV